MTRRRYYRNYAPSVVAGLGALALIWCGLSTTAQEEPQARCPTLETGALWPASATLSGAALMDANAAIEHHDNIRDKLLVAEAAHPNSNELRDLHNALGAAWEDAKAHFGINDAARDGGHKPPPEEPTKP